MGNHDLCISKLKNHAVGGIVAIAILSAQFSWAGNPDNAETFRIGDLELTKDPVNYFVVALFLSLEISLGIAGIVFGMGNSVNVAKDSRPALCWRIGGWIFGSIHTAGGIGWLLASRHNGWEKVMLGLGIGHLALGVFDIASTTWGTFIPEDHEPDAVQLSLSPILLNDADGNAAWGIGLQAKF